MQNSYRDIVKLMAMVVAVTSLVSCIKDNEKAASEDDLFWDAPYSKDVIVFDRKNWSGRYDVYKINADGSGQKNITRTPDADERFAAVSHNGERVAFATNGQIVHTDFNGANRVALTGSAFLVGNYFATNLNWSNKSTYITLNDFDPEPEVYYVATSHNLNSKELFTTGFKLPAAGIVKDAGFYGDHNRLLAVVEATDGYTVYSTPSSGFVPMDSVRTLYTSSSVIRTPRAFGSDEKIVFALANENGVDICVLDAANGGVLENLTNGDGSNTHPNWSPDGSRITYASNAGGNWDIWIMNADGSEKTNLTQTADWDEYNPSWN